MTISDTQKTDFLWKKIIYGISDTSPNLKQVFEENIQSPLYIQPNSVFADNVPIPAPGASSKSLQFYGPTSALAMTPDSSVSGQRTWLATTIHGDETTRVGNWIQPSIDPSYLVDIYKNDTMGSGTRLNSFDNNYEWIFDYQSGVLTFVNLVPPSISNLYLIGYRYIGLAGLSNPFTDELVYTGVNVSTGTATFTNFFQQVPITGSAQVSINGLRIDGGSWSINGTDLLLNFDIIPYYLENTDTISATYLSR